MKGLLIKESEYVRQHYAFSQWLQLLGYSPFSVYNVPNLCKEMLHWMEENGISSSGDIEMKDVDGYFSYLRKREKTRGGGKLSHNFLNKHLQAIKLFSRYLRESGQGGFAVEMDYFKAEKKETEILSVEEIRRLYASTTDDVLGLRDRVLLSVFYACGLRRNEGVQLDISDVLTERNLLYVRKGKNYSERYVPVHYEVMKDFNDYMQSSRPSLLIKKNEEPALIVSKWGLRANGQSLLLRFKKLQMESGDAVLMQKKVGLHSLRHSIATHLLMKGMKLERISKFLGHKSIESTQIYTHIAEEMKRNTGYGF
jgi:integrase/recombinase XerD